jgi:hypothetical protein
MPGSASGLGFTTIFLAGSGAFFLFIATIATAATIKSEKMIMGAFFIL